jgi:hypothetical protein
MKSGWQVLSTRNAVLWKPSSAKAPYVGSGYYHDDNGGKGTRSARYRAKLEPGRYEVRLSYSPEANRATHVPVTVHHRGGEKTLIINQRKQPPIDGATISLGIFTFGESGTVQVSNKGTDGYVILDAAQFLPVSK